MNAREEVRALTLPFGSMRTAYAGASEVRHYRNLLTGNDRVGKRIDVLGLEDTVAFQEGALLEVISHDNLVPVLDVAEVEGYSAPMHVIELVMPWYPRGSVCDALIAGHRFSVGEACAHATAALHGLAELHERHNLLHRDVKSPNVLLADDHTLAKLGDLGCATTMEPDGTAEPLETVQLYTAPESLSGGRASRATDVYGMGLLLFEMVNGPLPYASYETATAEMEARLRAGRPAPRTRDLACRPHVPDGMRRVINKAMQRDPAKRFQRAGHMTAALARIDLVDWRCTVDGVDEKFWEGATPRCPDRTFRVELHRTRRGTWRASALQVKNRPQRVVNDIDAAAPDAPAVRVLFDQVVALATRR